MKTAEALAHLKEIRDHVRLAAESLETLEMYAEFIANMIIENEPPQAAMEEQNEDHDHT